MARSRIPSNRISIGEYLELRHWLRVLGITPQQLRQAVNEIRGVGALPRRKPMRIPSF